MLEITIDGIKYDFNRLQEQIMLRVEGSIIFHLAQGGWDEYVAHPKTTVNAFIGAVLAGADGQSLDEKEKAWFVDLRRLAEAILSSDNDKYNSLGKEDRVRYAHRSGLRIADLLRPLLEGYISRSSPLCPASPSAKPGVTWETWKAALDPRRFFKIANKLPFVDEEDGTMSTGMSFFPVPAALKDGSDIFPGSLDCGEDKELFVKRADKFVPAALKIDLRGTIYRCSVDNAGLFIKRVETVSPCEPWEIAGFLRGKYLTARYARGGFNRDWVDTLIRGLEPCQGPLKDVFMLMSNGDLKEVKAKILERNQKEVGLREEKTVLIVDDDRDVIHLISVVLQQEAFEIKVLSAANGRAGLEALQREKVDLLVLNLKMPEMDGYQVLELMGKNEELRKIPVIMLTATPYNMSAYHGKPDPFAGMYVNWVETPFFDPRMLVKRIRGMLMESKG